MWSEHRVVRKDATLSLFGGLYQVSDLSLAGRKVECVFDPFDLSVLQVRWNGRPHGTAVRKGPGGTPTPKRSPSSQTSRRRRPESTTSASSGPSTRKPPAGTGSATTPSPPARTRTRRRAAGDPVPAAQVSAVLAWAARLAAAARPGTAETAAYLTAKAAVPWSASPPSESTAAGHPPRSQPPQRPLPAREAADAAASGRRRHHPPGGRTMIDLKHHYGFTRTPFGKEPRPVHAAPLSRPRRGRRPHHLVRPRESPRRHHRRGQRRQRPPPRRIAALDQTRHTLIYLPDPTTGIRGIHHHVVTASADGPPTAQPRSPPRPPPSSPPSTASADGSRCWPSTRPTCSATPSSRP